MARPELSLVIPIYNEEEVLPSLDQRLKMLLGRLGMDAEVVFVDDGSKDRSLGILRDLAGRDARYRVLSFARNFGHQRAITAGMDATRGHAVVVMDADLQDPPEVIQEMIGKWREGYDVVYGRRRSRQGETLFKVITAKLFYRVFAALIPIEVPLDTGDFRLMSRRVVTAMRGLRETHMFVRGLVAWVGFRQTAVEYDRSARVAGETKYPLRKMVSFALDGIASFSIQPLRFATYVGALVGTVSVLFGIAAVVSHLVGITVPGWTTLIVLVSFLFSVQFFMIGVLGEYVGRIYEQVKKRPLYVVSERINFGAKRPRVPRNVESTQEVAAITTEGSVVVVGVPDEKPVRRTPPPAQKTEEPVYFPKASMEVHTLFGHPAPEPRKPSAPPAMTLHVPVERGFSAPLTPPAPIPPDATAEIPLVTAKAISAIPPIVALVPEGDAPRMPSSTERGVGALAMLERARSAPPPPTPPVARASEPPEPAPTPMPILTLSADDTSPPVDKRPTAPPPQEPKKPSTPPLATTTGVHRAITEPPPPGFFASDVPPPPAALTAALAESEAAFNRPVTASRPPPARRPSIAEVPPPDAPRPAPLNLTGSLGAMPSAPSVEPATELPPVVETRPPAPTPTGRPRASAKPPNVTARLAALRPEASRPLAARDSERVPDTAKSATDAQVLPKPRAEDD